MNRQKVFGVFLWFSFGLVWRCWFGCWQAGRFGSSAGAIDAGKRGARGRVPARQGGRGFGFSGASRSVKGLLQSRFNDKGPIR